jgi:tRNA U34 2-thiouridine synthase MnmA/TrmU
VLAHESNREPEAPAQNRKNQTICFVDFDDSQGHYRHLMRELLLRPSDVWTKDRQELQQPKGLRWRLIDLIVEK